MKLTKNTIEKAEHKLAELRNAISEYNSIGEVSAAEKLVGKCFIYRGNSYSCPEKSSDYWDVYYHVVSNEGNWLNCIKVEKTAKYELQMTKDALMMIASIERLEEISLVDFKELSNEFLKTYIDMVEQL